MSTEAQGAPSRPNPDGPPLMRPSRHVQPLDVDRSDPLSLSPPSADVYDQMSEQASKTLEDEPRFLGTTGAGRRTLNWSALWRRPQMRLTGLLQQTNAFGLLYYGNQAPSLRARRLKTERAIAAAQKDEEAGEAIQSTLEDMALSRLGLPLHGADTPRTTQSGRETVTSRQHPRRGEISQTPIKDIQLYERGVQLRPTGVPAWQGVHPRSMAQRTERNPNLAFDEDNTNPTLHRAWTGNFPISHRKLQKLADLIRGLPIEMAILQMKFSHKAAAHPVLAMLEKARGEALARGFKHEQLAVGACPIPLTVSSAHHELSYFLDRRVLGRQGHLLATNRCQRSRPGRNHAPSRSGHVRRPAPPALAR